MHPFEPVPDVYARIVLVHDDGESECSTLSNPPGLDAFGLSKQVSITMLEVPSQLKGVDKVNVFQPNVVE